MMYYFLSHIFPFFPSKWWIASSVWLQEKRLSKAIHQLFSTIVSHSLFESEINIFFIIFSHDRRCVVMTQVKYWLHFFMDIVVTIYTAIWNGMTETYCSFYYSKKKIHHSSRFFFICFLWDKFFCGFNNFIKFFVLWEVFLFPHLLIMTFFCCFSIASRSFHILFDIFFILFKLWYFFGDNIVKWKSQDIFF